MERENEIAKEYCNKHKKLFLDLDKILLEFWNIPFMVPNKISPNLFNEFFIDTRNCLINSIISLIRNHFNVSGYLIRRAFESLVHSIYFMNLENAIHLIESSENNDLMVVMKKFNKKDKSKSYDYFEEVFPKESAEIQKMKDNLNDLCVHTNNINISNTKEIYGDKYVFDYFETGSDIKYIAQIKLITRIIDVYTTIIYINNKKTGSYIKVKEGKLIDYVEKISRDVKHFNNKY